MRGSSPFHGFVVFKRPLETVDELLAVMKSTRQLSFLASTMGISLWDVGFVRAGLIRNKESGLLRDNTY